MVARRIAEAEGKVLIHAFDDDAIVFLGELRHAEREDETMRAVHFEEPALRGVIDAAAAIHNCPLCVDARDEVDRVRFARRAGEEPFRDEIGF